LPWQAVTAMLLEPPQHGTRKPLTGMSRLQASARSRLPNWDFWGVFQLNPD